MKYIVQCSSMYCYEYWFHVRTTYSMHLLLYVRIYYGAQFESTEMHHILLNIGQLLSKLDPVFGILSSNSTSDSACCRVMSTTSHHVEKRAALPWWHFI